MNKKVVVVFGIFDGIHDGHRDFFRQAKEYGEELIAVVGRDESAIRLKNKKPRHTESERLAFVAGEQMVDKAVLGDRKLSSYSVLVRCNPDVICLGYDQQALGKDLDKWMKETGRRIPLHYLQPYHSDSFHSSLLGQDMI